MVWRDKWTWLWRESSLSFCPVFCLMISDAVQVQVRESSTCFVHKNSGLYSLHKRVQCIGCLYMLLFVCLFGLYVAWWLREFRNSAWEQQHSFTFVSKVWGMHLHSNKFPRPTSLLQTFCIVRNINFKWIVKRLHLRLASTCKSTVRAN